VTVFVIVGAVGLLLLLSSILLGDLLDAIGGGDGLVSGVALGAALAIYGVGGVLADQVGIGSVALALVALVVVQLAVRFVAKQESGGSYSPVGMVGVVTSPTSPTGGEVRLEHVRELERRLAVSDAPLSIGTRIRVVSEDGFRVRVEPQPGDPA
jgi:membrane protein implicated in regulation of membrane protease activity